MKMNKAYEQLSRVAVAGCRRLMAAAVPAGFLAGLIPASAKAGCLTGANTVDYVLLTPALAQGTHVEYTVKASGSGSNLNSARRPPPESAISP